MESIAKQDFEAGIDTDPKIQGIGLNALNQLFNQTWWSDSLNFIWNFRQLAYKPALLFALGEILAVLSLFLSMQDLVAIGVSGEAISGMGELTQILVKSALIIIVFGGASLVLVTWSVGLWIITLTGFCRAYLSQTKDMNVSKEELFEYQKSCVEQFKSRKAYLFVVWIIYSLIMFIPVAMYLISSTFIYMSLPGVLPYPVPFSQEQTIACWIIAVISTIVLSNHFLVALPLSAVSKKGGRKVATDSFLMALKSLPVITIFSLILGLLSFLVAVPDTCLIIFNLANQEPSLYWRQCLIQLVSAVWHAALSIIVFPLAVALPCELLRKNECLSK